MQDKIKQLAREEFVFEQPEILLSDDRLDFKVEAGKLYEGTLTVTNRNGEIMQGVFYTDTSSIRIRKNLFYGKQSEIVYEYDAGQWEPDKEEKGYLTLVSNLGEVKIPYHVRVIPPYFETSLGRIQDLFHFTNLSKASWNEAHTLFISEEFARVFLKRERDEILYRNLMKSSSSHLAMEEFLIAVHKKMKITLSFAKRKAVFKNCVEEGKDTAEILKDGWGYGEYHITADQDFLTLAKESFTTNDFVGNTYWLTYYLHPDLMHEGRNSARITVESAGQRLSFEVEAVRPLDEQKLSYQKQSRINVLKVYQNYLALRTGEMTKDRYIKELSRLLEEPENQFPEYMKPLLSVHFNLLSEQTEKAEMELGGLAEKVSIFRKERAWEALASFYYLQALFSKKDTDIKKALKEIQRIRKEEPGNGIFLWYLFYLDSSYEQNREKRLFEIRTLMEKEHTASPMLSMEAMRIMNENPALLSEYQPAYEKIMLWGAKCHYVAREAALKFVYLCRDSKEADERVLMKLYDQYASDEILEVVVKAMIRKNRRDEVAFLWYDRGVRHKLKIENLYEYYIYAVPKEYDRKIPSSVLMYFRYDNNLEKDAKAFLYAYLVSRRDREGSAYTAYEKVMRQFTIERLYQGEIDEHLALLYREFIDPEDMRDGMAVFISRILFKHRVTVKGEGDIRGIYIAHKELSKAEYYPLEQGICYADICTENVLYFAEDVAGNLYVETLMVQVEPLLCIRGLAEKCYESCKTNTNLLLHLFEKIQKYQKNNESGLHIRRRLMLMPGFKAACQGECYCFLIEHYLDYMDIPSLKEMLQIVEIEKVPKLYRPRIAEYCILYEQMEKAERILDEYGFAGVSYRQLCRFTEAKLDQTKSDIKSRFLLRLCYYLFDAGKGTEPILSYLLLHFEGGRGDMLRIFNAAVSCGLHTAEFEERLLCQMVFSESYGKHSYEVFRPYYERGGNPVLIKAFLAHNSYKYLLFDRAVPEYHFTALARELLTWNSMAGHLAMLKYLSFQDDLSEEEREYADGTVQYMVGRGVVLPYFKHFAKFFPLPQKIQNFYYVEYHTQPGNEVKIHYYLDTGRGKNQFREDNMRDVYCGIHIKEFVLFADESLQYYISETVNGQETITESRRVVLSDDEKMETMETGFGLINLILTAREMQDEKTMFELMEYYGKLKFLGENLFTPL